MEIKGYTDERFTAGFFPPRDKLSHKGDWGRVLIAAGSYGMAGACAFSAKAALKTGSGLVMVLTEGENVPVIQTLVPEAICLGEEDAWDRLSAFDAAAAGSGMGKKREAEERLVRILRDFNGPVVLDADGLNLLSESDLVKEAFRTRSKRKTATVITPHMGEAARLLGRETVKGRNRESLCRELFGRYGAITVLKGHHTCVAFGEDIWLNPTGNPGMATAGSGDALTGVIVSLLGRGIDPFDAARGGVYIHGLAGDIASEKLGEYSLTVTDILDNIPDAVKRVRENI